MDVVRLVEEIKEKCDGLTIENDDVFMNTKFSGRFIGILARVNAR